MARLTYQEVQDKIGTQRCHLLLGNGFSIACDPVFSYGSLYDYAKKKGLTEHVQGVFEYLGTNNFEGVLRLLHDGLWLTKHYGLTRGAKARGNMRKDLQSVKKALVSTLAKAHLARPGDVLEERVKCCANFVHPYHNIFTMNYDLLLYWVVMSDPELLRRDGFRDSEDEPEADYCVFTEHVGGEKGLFFVHGALHLYLEVGEVRKHTWSKSGVPLIDRVREGLDHEEYPLFVAEGTAEKKKIQIESSSYLSYCLSKFQRIQGPLVVFGLSLGGSDQHIVDAIAHNLKLPEVFIGLYGGDKIPQNKIIRRIAKKMVRERNAALAGNRRGKNLTVRFFDSTSAQIWDTLE